MDKRYKRSFHMYTQFVNISRYIKLYRINMDKMEQNLWKQKL
jgi:hypothetical protein